jgi:putative membrane protein
MRPALKMRQEFEMDRRSLVVAFAALSAAAVPALAQNQTSTTAAMGTMGDAEKKHILETLRVGAMSLELSRIAVEHAREAMVKQFANFEVAEQETIGDILKPLAAGAAPTDPMQASLVKKLESAGANFDRDYVQAEIEGHNKLLNIQEAYIAVGKEQSQLNVAKLARGMIKEHLVLLSDIEKGGMRG